MDMNINFPNLGINLEHVGKTISVFGFEIAFYGIIIALAFLAGAVMAGQEAKRTGQDTETYWDLLLYLLIFSIIGARAYYIAFSWDEYQGDLLKMINIRQGGLAIYGGIIASFLVIFIFSKVKKLNFFQLIDTVCLGVVLGQAIGRWGNFFNREVFGGYTDNLLAMQLPVSAVRTSDVTTDLASHIVSISGVNYIQVHPTFLYESLWNIGLLLILLWFRKHKKYMGELCLVYMFGYGIGRFWIEGIRTDQLLIPGLEYPVSQLLAAVVVVATGIILIVKRSGKSSSLEITPVVESLVKKGEKSLEEDGEKEPEKREKE